MIHLIEVILSGVRIKVIINADDLGASEVIDAAIFDLIGRGLITSASIMANGPNFEASVSTIKNHPQISFGVHLNITEYRPLTGLKGFGVIDENGLLNGRLRSRKPSLGLITAISNEWLAQIKKIKDAGITISHLDSHQHVHTIPWLFPALVRTVHKSGIQRLRLTKNIYLKPVGLAHTLKKNTWNTAIRLCAGTKTTSHFTGLYDFIHNPDRTHLRISSIELMVHPGHVSNLEFSEEIRSLETIRDNELRNATLITYHDL